VLLPGSPPPPRRVRPYFKNLKEHVNTLNRITCLQPATLCKSSSYRYTVIHGEAPVCVYVTARVCVGGGGDRGGGVRAVGVCQ
jgi:hypothetical protein